MRSIVQELVPALKKESGCKPFLTMQHPYFYSSRSMRGSPATYGFTLIEMMVVLAIVAVVFMLSLPSYRTYVNNSKIRGEVQKVYADLQSARVSAIQKNANVDFALSASDPVITIEAKTDAASPVAVSSISFTGLGRTTAGQKVNIDFQNAAGGACMTEEEPGNPMRCLRVVVSTAGQVRVCDPLVTEPSDTRKC